MQKNYTEQSSLVFDTTEDHHKDVPEWVLTTAATFALIISIIGFLGNLLTILALPFTRKLRTAATWFIVNLAIIEMLFCITVLPMSGAHLLHLKFTGEKLFGVPGCRLFVFIRYVIIQTELLSIAAIALNRCILIAFPKKYPLIFTNFKTASFICGIWALSIAIMLFPLIGIYGAFSYNKYTQECDFDDKSVEARKVFLAIGFLIPCLIIVISYSYIFYKSKKSAQKMNARKAAAVSLTERVRPAAGLRTRELRIARTIAVIFLVFLICCTPVTIAHYYGSQGQIPVLLMLLHPLYWLQYCLNIFIYVFMNRQYREAYIDYISHWWPRFKVLTQRCYHSAEEETSGSQPGTSLQGIVNRIRNKSNQKKDGSESSSHSLKIDHSPNSEKKI